jgi:hypothetical protein
LWLGTFAATFLASAAAGWFLPDGLNAVADLLGEQSVPVTALTRFFSVAVLLVLSAGIELILWLRSQSLQASAAIDDAVKASLERHSVEMAETALVRSLLPHNAATPEEAAEGARLLKAFGRLLAMVPPNLLAGYSVLIDRGMAQIATDVRAVATPGLNVDIEQHIQITRRLAQRGGAFTQINRNAYSVPQEWTQEWVNLVDDLGKVSPTPEYIVLMPRKDLDANAAKIHEMSTYLGARGWSFRCCDLDQVEDSLGAAIPPDNIDVYGDVAAKLHPAPSGPYRGRLKFDLRLVDLDGQAELRRFISTVRRFGRTPSPDWPSGSDGPSAGSTSST